MGNQDARPQEFVKDSYSTAAPWTSGPVEIGGPRVVIGSVDEVNGRGALAVPEFIASRYELLVLLKHWVEVENDIEFWWFCHEQFSSSDTRLRTFAGRRIDRIAEALADEACVKEAIEEVYEAFGEQNGGLAWKVFRQEATPQEEREFREEQRELLGGGDTDPVEDPA